MTDPLDQDVVVAAHRLEISVNKLRDEINNLRVYGQRSRRLIIGLAVSIVLDVLLSAAVGLLAIQAVSTSNRANEANSLASRNAQNQLITCQAGNESRAAQVQLWNYVLDLAARNPNQSPDQVERLKQFRAYLTTALGPRDCTARTPSAVSLSAPPPSPLIPTTR
jgi:hypothetical protein